MTATNTTTGLPLTPGTWALDHAHKGIHFSVRHLGVAKVRGQFKEFDANVVVGETLADTSLEVTVDLSSVDTNQPDRDAHLRSTDFFSLDEHPQLTFRSTGVRDGEDSGEYLVDGDLTVNGVTKPLTLEVSYEGSSEGPDGKVHAGFEAKAEVNRKDFGVDFNIPMGAGGFVIGDKVKIEIDAELIAPE